jgi:hypothetical protein
VLPRRPDLFTKDGCAIFLIGRAGIPALSTKKIRAEPQLCPAHKHGVVESPEIVNHKFPSLDCQTHNVEQPLASKTRQFGRPTSGFRHERVSRLPPWFRADIVLRV